MTFASSEGAADALAAREGAALAGRLMREGAAGELRRLARARLRSVHHNPWGPPQVGDIWGRPSLAEPRAGDPTEPCADELGVLARWCRWEAARWRALRKMLAPLELPDTLLDKVTDFVVGGEQRAEPCAEAPRKRRRM